MAGTFEIYQDAKGQYRFRLKARNGEVVATGESYTTKAGAIKGIGAVQRAAEGAAVKDTTE
jgi:uncharacterized protein YegP (UPF0339 family)